jgi:large subunit ribosomal protein L30
MLKKAKDFITYGPLNKKTLVELLKKRGKTIGDKPLNEKNLKEITKFKDFDDFADNLIKEKVKIKDFKKIKPIFRLNPPKKGFKSTRISYPKGDLGFRKDGVDKLLERMI